MKLMIGALLAGLTFSTNLIEKPVFAQDVATIDIAPATAPSMAFHDADVLTLVGSGQGGPTQFVYASPSQKMEKGTYLGVTTSAVPAALREQMSLQKGLGLVVETVEKDSPADKAGIQKYDILQKLNDQMLINQPQLQVLVRMMKPNEQVTITLLRKGQPTTVTATLQEKDVPELGDATFDAPGMFAPRIMQWRGQADPAKILGDLNISADKLATISSSDGDQTLELTEKNGSKQLVVKDKSGKVIFDGPINTAEEKAKLPEGVAEKLDSMDSKLKKITVRIRANNASPDKAPEAGNP